MTHTYTVPKLNDKTQIMGIMNITPDSFSGDGLLNATSMIDQCLKQAEAMEKAGCTLLDVGAESTRPGATMLGEDEELERILPVIDALIQNSPLPLSIDTTKAVVAKAALERGAIMINDVSGLTHDPKMCQVVSAHQCYTVIMHHDMQNRVLAVDTLGGSYLQAEVQEESPIQTRVLRELTRRADSAIRNGLDPSKIIIDVGIGFGKTREENLALIAHMADFTILPYPILLGASRKSFIGHTTKAPVDQRLGGSLAVLALGILGGARIIRVHDVFESVQAAQIVEAVQQMRNI